jgi:hypothetical protein
MRPSTLIIEWQSAIARSMKQRRVSCLECSEMTTIFVHRTKYAGDNFVRTSGVIKDFATTQSKVGGGGGGLQLIENLY